MGLRAMGIGFLSNGLRPCGAMGSKKVAANWNIPPSIDRYGIHYIYIYIWVNALLIASSKSLPEAMEGGRQPHPLLRGGRREGPYTHGFSHSMLSSLSCICEAIVPSLQVEDAAGKEELPDKAVQAFYSASGSAQPVPDEVTASSSSILSLVV